MFIKSNYLKKIFLSINVVKIKFKSNFDQLNYI